MRNVSDVHNPFYRGKDPMKEIYWKHKNADGTWGFVYNPFFKPEGVQYPGNPWNDPISIPQRILMNKMLRKKLGQIDNMPKVLKHNTGPNGVVMFYRNPYYTNKDPMVAILKDETDGAGRPIIRRNPMVPAPSGVLWSNTYEMIEQKGFFQPEVDPWLQ